MLLFILFLKVSERNKLNIDFCCDLMTEVLRVGYTESNIVKARRLGSCLATGMVKSSDKRFKKLIMQFTLRLSQANDQFTGVTISHDMTIREREMCRRLIAEANQKQEDEFGNNVQSVGSSRPDKDRQNQKNLLEHPKIWLVCLQTLIVS